MKIFLNLVVIGIVSGLVLGGVLKTVEQLTGKLVYTLLLNVDYFPVIQDWPLNEVQDFLLHIVVSVGLVIVLYFTLDNGKIHHYIVMSVLIGGLLYLTTAFSGRTPALTDVTALMYWLMGHLIYGIIVGILIVLMKKGLDDNETKEKE
ncbi:hypothetical protein KFZ58_17425 [Virgibacillus sp. NKC19-16]|uniref:hypothetical protein n=1 Tax=Virgibacillus salidurans TaxID=2831673 RepID=UPI001F39FC0A|nr:hypothetical protein [Virgibacillus sp. NKC19-16]UJL46118.1 hypothetical protein KFZ58_17425 [Virgibacillus sp. NKC19-16]